jgi:hypothetical protein
MKPAVLTALLLIALYFLAGCVSSGGWYTNDLRNL